MRSWYSAVVRDPCVHSSTVDFVCAMHDALAATNSSWCPEITGLEG